MGDGKWKHYLSEGLIIYLFYYAFKGMYNVGKKGTNSIILKKNCYTILGEKQLSRMHGVVVLVEYLVGVIFSQIYLTA